MTDRQIRNMMRRKTTINRYVTDSNCFWREELHPRIDNLQPLISNKCEDVMKVRITDNIWGFPVDEQSTANAQDVFLRIIEDYFQFVKGRRTWVYTETDGYWTEENIVNTIAYAFVMGLWDIGKEMLIHNYPLVQDDLRYRSGRTHMGDERQTYHDSLNKVGTGSRQYTEHDNERNKIMENTDSAGSDTQNSRATNNTTTINDVFLSPQNQGVTPSKQSTNVMNHGGGFESPENHGVAEVTPNGQNGAFTTNTSNVIEGSTDTVADGRTSTNRNAHSRVDENDYLEGNETFESDTGAENNVGAKTKNDSEHERQETLDVAGVLQSFYDIFKDRLLMEIDNRMLPYYLNMKIARFTDHRIGRKEYV